MAGNPYYKIGTVHGKVVLERMSAKSLYNAWQQAELFSNTMESFVVLTQGQLNKLRRKLNEK